MFKVLKNDFHFLFRKFREGVPWINRTLAQHGEVLWVRQHIERFEREVIAPMDEAWTRMTEEQKREVINGL